jgi:hypothetical protein
MRKEGIVYILSNPYFKEGIYKIGMTTRSAEKRAWEIYVQATGVPGQFKIEHKEFTFDCAGAEKKIHRRLRKKRINEYREFFDLDIDYAIKTMREEVEIINSRVSSKRKKSIIKEVIIREVDGLEIEKPETEKHLDKPKKTSSPIGQELPRDKHFIDRFDELINSEQLSSDKHDELTKAHESYTQGLAKEKAVHENSSNRGEAQNSDLEIKRDLSEYKTSFIRDPGFLIFFISGILNSFAAVGMSLKERGIVMGVVLFSCLAVFCFLMSIRFAKG